MSYRLQPQAAALGLAALVTAGTLGSLGAMADSEYRSATASHAQALLAQAEIDTPSSFHQVVVTGHRLQQVVVVGRRRG
ncbi:MAG: hypothetical protein AB1430_06465 [Pseudomonadota bacterium]